MHYFCLHFGISQISNLYTQKIWKNVFIWHGCRLRPPTHPFFSFSKQEHNSREEEKIKLGLSFMVLDLVYKFLMICLCYWAENKRGIHQRTDSCTDMDNTYCPPMPRNQGIINIINIIFSPIFHWYYLLHIYRLYIYHF